MVRPRFYAPPHLFLVLRTPGHRKAVWLFSSRFRSFFRTSRFETPKSAMEGEHSERDRTHDKPSSRRPQPDCLSEFARYSGIRPLLHDVSYLAIPAFRDTRKRRDVGRSSHTVPVAFVATRGGISCGAAPPAIALQRTILQLWPNCRSSEALHLRLICSNTFSHARNCCVHPMHACANASAVLFLFCNRHCPSNRLHPSHSVDRRADNSYRCIRPILLRRAPLRSAPSNDWLGGPVVDAANSLTAPIHRKRPQPLRSITPHEQYCCQKRPTSDVEIASVRTAVLTHCKAIQTETPARIEAFCNDLRGFTHIAPPSMPPLSLA